MFSEFGPGQSELQWEEVREKESQQCSVRAMWKLQSSQSTQAWGENKAELLSTSVVSRELMGDTRTAATRGLVPMGS